MTRENICNLRNPLVGHVHIYFDIKKEYFILNALGSA